MVHVVRNPVEVLISAYLYHQKEEPVPEEWLREPKPDALELLPAKVQSEMHSVPYYQVPSPPAAVTAKVVMEWIQVLHQLPPELGLKAEFAVEMEDLYRMGRNYRDMAFHDAGINIKYCQSRSWT